METSSRAHRWHLDYLDDATDVSAHSQAARLPSVRTAVDQYATPPGYPPNISSRDPFVLRDRFTPLRGAAQKSEKTAQQALDALTAAYKSSWSIAFSPFRTVVTSGFALFMTGSTVQFFSVMTTLTVLFMQLRTMFSLRSAFSPILQNEPHLANNPGRIIPQLLVYVLVCSLGVAIALYKCQLLGFLPTTQSDYISLLPSSEAPRSIVFETRMFHG